MITRDAARALAMYDALRHGLGNTVLDVLLPVEIYGPFPMVYNVSLDNCWIAYVENSGQPALRSSTIILVCRERGEIIYRGSAHDEG
ncbi:MAG: hypothetical protein J0653_03470 [Deltaproteobacteria bacterium]|nr:hypothetical protein [Deltaproteobacteria bacterium]